MTETMLQSLPGLKTIVDEASIRRRCAELGAEITRDYLGKDLVLVAVLKGAVVFLADLARCIDLPLTMDFLRVSSYGDAQESSGVVRFELDLSQTVTDKDVLIVEDIIDTGLTMSYLRANLLTRSPRSLRVCALLDKPSRRLKPVEIDYLGFTIPNEFVIGFGLDHQGQYRNIPFVGAMPRVEA